MNKKIPQNIKELKEILKNPHDEFSVAPFWLLNGDLNEKELLRQLKEIYLKGIREFFIHPRFGLEIPYLSEEWHMNVNIILKKAKELNMKVWIYDEIDWPSGYAGGNVIESNNDFRAKNLSFFYKKTKGPKEIELSIPEGKLIGIFKAKEKNDIIDENSVEDITNIANLQKFTNFNTPKSPKNKAKFNLQKQSIKELDQSSNNSKKFTLSLPVGDWVVLFFIQRYCNWRNLYQKEPYIDVLNKKAVAKFIELTHKQYYKHHKKYFTNTLVGFYCDEPGMYTNLFGIDQNSIPWTDELPQFFKQKRGYDLLPKLFSIWMDTSDMSDKVRYDYYDVVSQIYKQNYFGQIHSWCKNHNVKFSGHLLLEENLVDTIKTQGNFFEAIKLMDIPGVDIVKDIDESKSLTPKLASSIAHFKRKERSSCETFGMFGWDLTFEKMKYVTDWLCVRGINMIIPHALFYSTEGERKNDCPPSLFFQNPIWKKFKEYADYTKRLCYLLSLGKHFANIALYYPIVSGWTNIRPDNIIKVNRIDNLFKELGNLLFKNQWDYDILDDKLINEAVISQKSYLCSESESYKILIIPYSLTIPLNTLEKIYKFCEKGGVVIFSKGEPENIANQDEKGNFLTLKENLFKKDKFKNFEFFQNKINKGICFFKDKNNLYNFIDKKRIYSKDNKRFIKSKKISNFFKKSSLFNKLLKVKIIRNFLQLIYKVYKTLNKTIKTKKHNFRKLNPKYRRFFSRYRSFRMTRKHDSEELKISFNY